MNAVPPPHRSGSGLSGSTGRSNVPSGIYVIVGIGFLSAFLAFLVAFEFFVKGPAVVVGIVLLLAAAEMIVPFGLLRLQSWAWILAVALYGLGAVLDRLTLDLLGGIVSVGIVAYLASVADEFD